MRQRFFQLATLVLLILSFSIVRAIAQQNPPAQDQQNPNAPSQQRAQNPPHDVEPNPDARQVEKNIQSAFNQDPNHAFRRVRVQNTDSELILSGVVTTADAKDQAEQIAKQYAGGKKITNRIKVNPNVHPGPGL